jgi:uncharacterized phage protein gp47/JayE
MAETKDTILNRMLSYISNIYDKTIGSFFYDATMPVAIELEKLDAKADAILNKGFADTATGADLERKCSEQGIVRKPATKATGSVAITGIVGSPVVKGEMVSSDTASFIFAEDKVIQVGGSVNVMVECVEFGSIGNVPAARIKYFPKTLEGLQTVTNPQPFKDGYDAESDESLRQRYYDKIRTPATSGNKYHYKNWSKEVTGVGDAKVFPLANGAGTVKVVIINSNKRAADQALIDDVTEYINDNRPIGATVSVVSATEIVINVNVALNIDTNNYTVGQVTTAMTNNITSYLKEIAFVNSYVSYASIGNVIYNTDGVIDYSGLLVNNGTANITLLETEVAVLGGVIVG